MFHNFYDTYIFLEEHAMYKDEDGFSNFYERTHLSVVKVNPVNECIEDYDLLNTEARIWLRTGAYHKDFFIHDFDLDCGGKTFEEAIFNLATLVNNKFGNDKPTQEFWKQYWKQYPSANFEFPMIMD